MNPENNYADFFKKFAAGAITTDGILGTWAHQLLEDEFSASIDSEDQEEAALMDPMEFTDAVGSDEYRA